MIKSILLLYDTTRHVEQTIRNNFRSKSELLWDIFWIELLSDTTSKLIYHCLKIKFSLNHSS